MAHISTSPMSHFEGSSTCLIVLLNKSDSEMQSMERVDDGSGRPQILRCKQARTKGKSASDELGRLSHLLFRV